MCTEKELIEKAKDLFKRLGGIGNADARIVRGLIKRIEGAKNTEQQVTRTRAKLAGRLQYGL